MCRLIVCNDRQYLSSVNPYTHGPGALSEIRIQFGNRLREVRLANGISQEALAAEAGLHRTYVSSVERGLRNVSLVNIARLADALGVEIREFFPKS